MTENEQAPYKYIQTIVSAEEFQEIDDYMHRKGVKNRREWIKATLLKEARTDGTGTLPLH